jgi:molecular chaperone DnaJ
VADISFEQAVFGATMPVTLRTAVRCDDCSGTGAGEGTKPVTCSECNGRGQVQRVRQSMLGQMVTTSACPRAAALGQVIVTPCHTCRGEGRVVTEKTYQVDVPAGVDTGSTLRLTGRGAVGPREAAAPATCTCTSGWRRTSGSVRDGDDLVTELPVSIAQASLGTKFTLPTLDGDEEIVVPGRHPARARSSCSAAARRAPPAGPRPRRPAGARAVEVPTKLTEFEVELLKKLRRGAG